MTLDPVKISEKSALTAADSAAGDRFPVIDVSAGQLKTMTRAELATAVGGSSAVTADRALVSDGSGAVAASAVTATELGRLSGVTSAVQTQLDAKAATSHSHAIADVTNLQTTLDGKASTGSVAAVAASLGELETDVETLETSVAGKQASNANLTALAGLTGEADRVPYFTALATLALAVLTSFGRSLIAAADAAGVRSLLGLGTAAQSNTGDFAAASHSHAAAEISDSTTAGRAVLTAADAAAQRTALGLGTAAVEAATAFVTLAPATSARNEIIPADNSSLAIRLKQKSGGQATLYELRRSDDTKALTIGIDGIFLWNAAGTSVVGRLSDSGVTGWGVLYALNLLSLGDGSREWNPGTGLTLVRGDKIRYAATAYGAVDIAWETPSAGRMKATNGSGTARDVEVRHLLSEDFQRLANPLTTASHTIFEAITGLAQTLTAGKTYAGRLVLIVSCPTPGDGVRVDFDGGTATFYNAHAALTGNVQGATVTTSRYAGTGSVIDCSALADDGRHYLVFDVTLSVNAGGTFVPQFSKSSDATGDALTIHDGSYFDLREVR